MGQKWAQNRPKNTFFHLSVHFLFHFENNFFFKFKKFGPKKGPKMGQNGPKNGDNLKKMIVIIFMARNYTT